MVRASLFTLPDDLTFTPVASADKGRSVSRWLAGEENLLARRAAFSIGKEPLEYNPIVVFGPAGVGKSAYLQVLVRAFPAPSSEVLFSTASDFSRTFGRAHHQDSLDTFRNRLRRLRLLVIDELDDLAGKNPSQRELAATIDALTRRGALVLGAARKPLSEISGLLPSLVSRLSAGLSFPIHLPRKSTAIALVQYFAQQHGLELSEKWIQQIVANQQSTSGLPITPFQLQQTIRVVAQLAEENNNQLSESLLVEALKTRTSAARPKPAEIVSATARYYHLPVAELRGPSRRADLVRARSLAMYLIRHLAGASLQATGRLLGNRDHTTVMHALRKIEDQSASDPLVKQALTDLTNAFSLAEPKE